MTRICEKFVEELTSGNRQFSTELREHLAGCPECQQAAAALGLLAATRKPLSGSEVAAIATVLKAVKTDAATSAAANPAPAVTGSSTLRHVLLATLGIAIIASVLVNRSIEEQRKASQAPQPLRQIQPAMPSASGDAQPAFMQSEDSLLPPIEYNDSSIPLINHEVAASETANPATMAEEVTASPASEIKMVSPDEEEITP